MAPAAAACRLMLRHATSLPQSLVSCQPALAFVPDFAHWVLPACLLVYACRAKRLIQGSMATPYTFWTKKKNRLRAARLALAIAIGVDEGNGAAQVDSYDQLVNCARLLKQESALASNVGPVLEDSSRQPILMGSSEQMGASLLQACHVDASVDQSKHLFQWRLLAKPRGRCVLRPPLLGPASLTRTTADLMQWFRTRHLEGLLQNFEETNPSLNLETLDNMLAFVLRMQFQRRDSQSTTSWVSNGWPR